MSQQGSYETDYQRLLDMVAANDKYGFLEPFADQYDTHRPLLFLGLILSNGVITEMGSGLGSTPFIRKYCADNSNRPFNTYDSNITWAEKTGSVYVQDWNIHPAWQQVCGLLFIDHAPGEHRWKAIHDMAGRADIIVFHDSEIGGAGNYQYDRIYPLFKYQLHYNRYGGGAGCSMVSNKIDVSVYKGLKLGNFQFDNE